MLAGNTPTYNGISNDEYLHLRLSDAPNEPIVLQDLKMLSEVRPISVWVDGDNICNCRRSLEAYRIK